MRPAAFALLAAFASVAVAQDKAAPVKVVGKLAAPAPAEWKAEKTANRLRSYQFKLPGVDGMPDGEVVVFPDANPDPAKTLTRRKGEFVPPDGKSADDLGKTSTFDAGPAKVTALDVSGTWKFKEFPMAKKEEVREGYRVVWALVAVKDEGTLVRLSGPEPVVAKYYPGFEKWLKSLR